MATALQAAGERCRRDSQHQPGQQRSDFFGPNYYTKVPFAQIYYDYSPYLAQVAQTFLPTSPFLETHFNNPKYTSLYYQANKTQNPEPAA